MHIQSRSILFLLILVVNMIELVITFCPISQNDFLLQQLSIHLHKRKIYFFWCDILCDKLYDRVQ